jgi:hypothetical protein
MGNAERPSSGASYDADGLARDQGMTLVKRASVFDLEPAAVQWLAETFQAASPQHALLESLALSAEPGAVGREVRRPGAGRESRPLLDLLSLARVGRSVRKVAMAFPDLPIPREPGRAQLRAIDNLIRQSSRGNPPIGT